LRIDNWKYGKPYKTYGEGEDMHGYVDGCSKRTAELQKGILELIDDPFIHAPTLSFVYFPLFCNLLTKELVFIYQN